MPRLFQNPFRPGAGHAPPYLAGREQERRDFERMLEQLPVMTNLVLTGLRGVGKTVLLETLKPLAIKNQWLWAGNDLSESAAVSESSIATRILADLAPLTSKVVIDEEETNRIGFAAAEAPKKITLTHGILERLFNQTPGLVSDKLKAVLAVVWASLRHTDIRGIVLAYDEAQNLSDQAAEREFPLSLLLDVFQSIQKREIPILLVLTGLPTLFPKLVNARTFAERMFHVTVLERLSDAESREAILRPVQDSGCPVKWKADSVASIIKHSGGYPFFIQYLCRELFDSYLQQAAAGIRTPSVILEAAVHKLDSDFFAGRWSRVTDRQRALLTVIARLPNCDEEFTLQAIVAMSKQVLQKPFSPSHVNQILVKLSENGLVYKNRHGRYSFAVPLLGGFIRRQDAATSR